MANKSKSVRIASILGQPRNAAAGFEERGDLVFGEGALGAIGDSQGADGTAVLQHGDNDGAFHAGLFRTGADVAGGVGLDVAGVDGLGAFDGESGHPFADRHTLHDLKDGIGYALRGFEMEDAVVAEDVDGAGFGLEMRDGEGERMLDGLRRGERCVEVFEERHALIVQHRTR
jgi:hypothetical protein